MTEAADSYLKAIADGFTRSGSVKLVEATAVARAFWRAGLISRDFALLIKAHLTRRIGHGGGHIEIPGQSHPGEATTKAFAMLEPNQEFLGVVPVERLVHLDALGAVFLSDAEVWSGQRRLHVVAPGGPAQLLPSALKDLRIVDQNGRTHSLELSVGRGFLLSGDGDSPSSVLYIRSAEGSDVVTVDFSAAKRLAGVAGDQASPTTGRAVGPDDYMRQVIEWALSQYAGQTAQVVGDFDFATREVEVVAGAFKAVGALEKEATWYRDGLATVLRRGPVSDPYWIPFMEYVNSVSGSADAQRRLIPLAAGVGVLEGVDVVLRSLEIGPQKMTLNCVVTPKDGLSSEELFSSWPEALWRAVDDRNNLYLGYWGRSWPGGEYSVSFRPTLVTGANTLEVTRSGDRTESFQLGVSHATSA